MNRLSLAVLAVLMTAPASWAAPTPSAWKVTCLHGGVIKTWTSAAAPDITRGAFQFTAQDGTEVLTTAGMNCYAERTPPKSS